MASTNCRPAPKFGCGGPGERGAGSLEPAPELQSPVNISEPFIHRPIATSLLMAGVVLMGMLGYFLLPISSLPPVDFPTIQVTAQYPGRQPGRDGFLGDHAAGAAVRPDQRPAT